MPTSTLWRRDASAPLRRGSSPVRPTLAVERISPEPRGASPPPLVGLGLDSSTAAALGSDGHSNSHTSSAFTTTTTTTYTTYAAYTAYTTTSARPARARSHARSRSTIDDLADAAIATSPSLSAAIAASAGPAQRPASSHITRYAFHDSAHDAFREPPAKRVKSDIVRQYEFAFSYDRPRPATSHHASPPAHAIPDEDVALLLALKQEVNFKTQPSPVVPVVPVVPANPEPAWGEADADRQVNGEHTVEQQRPQDQNTEQPAEPAPKREEPREKQSEELSEAPKEAPKQDHKEQPKELPKELPKKDDKKPRRVRPLVQAELCAHCGRLQHDSSDDDVAISWICCNPCNRWFHSACVGFKSKAEARSVDKFVCAACQPAHGPSTFVRTSSRARTAIDYAELNQGLVKSAVDSPLHHYIEPLKTGRFAIQPDDFMRVPPELVTADFLQSFDGMKRPFVVPAAWNPRFGQPRAGADTNNNGCSNSDALLTECFDSSGASLGPQPAPGDDDDDDTTPSTEPVVDCDQDLLDMVMPRDLTVRTVAELYGKHNTVAVIDVKSQESKALTLEQWADYYEAAGDKPIRNVISLEVTQCPLGRVIRRPKAVRDLDLEDAVWSAEARGNQKRRHVQYYCLMSVADSYTDFHIDFGGSSVYYHILRGTKTFFFIPPEDRYLRKYEEWCNSASQSDVWLPDLCNGNVTRVDLHPGDTAFIPAGWIHSVWTPEDSLVIGGNFLTPIDYELQLKVVQIEKATNVASTFRYPYFQKVMWFTLIKYLDDDPVPDEVMADFLHDPDYLFLRATPVWLELGHLDNDEPPGSPAFNARYYPKSEVRGWPALRDYLYRTARVHADLPVDNINKKQIDAVKASIPKGYGDPLALIKTFAVWCAWKIGCVPAPPWLYSDSPPLSEADKLAKKKPETYRVPGERSSARRAAQLAQRDATGPAVVTPYKPGFNAPGVNPDPNKKGRPPSTKPVAARVACEACRRRRVKCKHKDAEPATNAHLPITKSQSLTPPPFNSDLTPRARAPSLPLPAMTASTDTECGHSLNSAAVQPALATPPDAQPADAAQAAAAAAAPNPLVSSPKKSRSKACEECRKSKRRCVHDEFGRVDPAKAAEPSKPRGSSSAKRPARPSDDGTLAKRVKLDDPPSILDPALFTSPPASNSDNNNDNNDNNNNPQPSSNTASTTAKPNNINDTAVKVEPDGDAQMTDVATTAADPYEHAILDSPESNNQQIQNHHSNGITSTTTITTPTKTKRESTSPSTHRHSSRQSKQVDRFVPAPTTTITTPANTTKSAKTPRRNSSAPSSTHHRPSPVKNRRRSSQTFLNHHHNHINGTAVATVATVATVTTHSSPPSTTKRPRSLTTGSISRPTAAAEQKKHHQEKEEADKDSNNNNNNDDDDEDEDEKLARQLQAQEHGLRRRTMSMRLQLA